MTSTIERADGARAGMTAFLVVGGTLLAACSGARSHPVGGGDASDASEAGSAGSVDGDAGAGVARDDAGARAIVEAGANGLPDAWASADGGSSCGAGDPNLPPEPTIPPACVTLTATRSVAVGALPSESAPDTAGIQSALDSCATGEAVRLVTSGANDAFLTGPLTLPTGVTLWVDTGVTLYGTRDPSLYGSATALILAKGASSGVVGDGVIDGQGGELRIGTDASAWDVNGAGGESPALIESLGATNFVLYRITLHDAPMFHVKLDARGFIVWGITIQTPSTSTNSAGTPLTPSVAHNTDGIDPGESAENGFIVCNRISDGDDHIAIKGSVGIKNLVIAHNRLQAGHGMSIGSEVNGGVSGVHVYDMLIDGTGSGLSGGSSNGIRIKSDSSRGGLVTDVLYEDVCLRQITNPILVTPRYSAATGKLIPSFQGIVIRDFHATPGAQKPMVTLDGYDATHATQITLDNVTVEGIASSQVAAEYAQITLGPGAVNFTATGTGVTLVGGDGGAGSTNDPCLNK